MLDTLKNRIKKKLYAKLGVSFNPFGVPFALGRHLEGASQITLVDVGAYRGEFTEAVDRFCGVARGILVEPQPAHAAHLRQTFQPPRFQVVEAVVCDQTGTKEMEVNNWDATSSILKTRRDLPEFAHVDVRAAEKIVCRATTLDAICEEARLAEVDLLKLDVQGAEHLVLIGGAKTLAHTRFVWTETSFTRLYEGSSLHHDLIEILARSGFALYELQPGFRGARGELLCADALFLRP